MTTQEGGEMAARSRKEHSLKSVFDVAELFASLDPEGRAILAADLVLAGEMIRKTPAIIRKFTRMKSFTWIDDDKGHGTFTLSATGEGPELVRWETDRR